MIHINFIQPSTLVINDLNRHVVMAAFIENVLLTAGIEVRWEYTWDPMPEEHGMLVLSSKKFVCTHWIGTALPPPPTEQRQESM